MGQLAAWENEGREAPLGFQSGRSGVGPHSLHLLHIPQGGEGGGGGCDAQEVRAPHIDTCSFNESEEV